MSFRQESPFAVTRMAKDKEGNFLAGSSRPAGLKNASRDLHLDLAQISRAWARGEEMGLWHRDGPTLAVRR